MPTTSDEAKKILAITTKYMPLHRAVACFRELDQEVGQVSENDSVKQSFIMFRSLAEYASEGGFAATGRDRRLYLVAFYALVLLHAFLVLGNVASFFTVPFYAPWYLAFPACFSILWVVCSNVDCVMTRWENALRVRLGMKTISGFVSHYFVKPIRRGIQLG